MIQQAIASDDPVMFYEPKRRYHERSEVDLDQDAGPQLPLHAARIARTGTDLTLLAYGPTVKTALDAAAAAQTEGRSIEVIDLRSLSPLDTDLIFDSVRRTGRAVVVHEASTFLGMGAELAAQIQRECFYSLQAPVMRVGGYNIPYPPSCFEQEFLPDLDRILDTVDQALAF